MGGQRHSSVVRYAVPCGRLARLLLRPVEPRRRDVSNSGTEIVELGSHSTKQTTRNRRPSWLGALVRVRNSSGDPARESSEWPRQTGSGNASAAQRRCCLLRLGPEGVARTAADLYVPLGGRAALNADAQGGVLVAVPGVLMVSPPHPDGDVGAWLGCSAGYASAATPYPCRRPYAAPVQSLERRPDWRPGPPAAEARPGPW